jgi:hypothetical protein
MNICLLRCCRCVEGYSGRDCGFTAVEAQARSTMQEMVLEHISNLTMAATAPTSVGDGCDSAALTYLCSP